MNEKNNVITENKNGRVTQIFTVQFNQSSKGEANSEPEKDQAVSKGGDSNKIVNSTTLPVDNLATANKYY